MAPLKPYFLGEAIPPAPDLCNVQPCVRTIDIADVGDRHHLTFFEMLGSWSIGHYFKERAVRARLRAAHRRVRVQRRRAVRDRLPRQRGTRPPAGRHLGERLAAGRDTARITSSTWATRTTSGRRATPGRAARAPEIFYDTGPEHGSEYRPGGEFDSTGRYIEIWNAGVFMEYNRLPGGRPGATAIRQRRYRLRPGAHVDGPAGPASRSTRRTCSRPIVAAVESALAGTSASQRDIRLVADHVRASALHPRRGRRPVERGPRLHPAAAAAHRDRDRDAGRRAGR